MERNVKKTIMSIASLVFFLILALGSDDSGTSSTSPSGTSKKIEAWVMAKSFVKEYLKSPSTADFGGTFTDYQDPEQCVTYMGDNTYHVRGWVDAQNSFGGTVRTNFLLKLKYNGNESWSLLEPPIMKQR